MGAYQEQHLNIEEMRVGFNRYPSPLNDTEMRRSVASSDPRIQKGKQPKVLYKYSPEKNIKKTAAEPGPEETELLIASPMMLKSGLHSRHESSTTKDDTHLIQKEFSHSPGESKDPVVNGKQVRWETSKKSFGMKFTLDPRTESVIKNKNMEKFTEIPHLLDGFRMLNHAAADDPSEVYSLNLSKCNLEYIIEDDLPMFKNLNALDLSENALPFAKLGSLTGLKKLNFSCNGLKSLDLEVEGRFLNLESLDLAYNNIDRAALIVLATLPNLKFLDLTANRIKYIAPEIQDMEHWKDHVITLILPFQVAELGLHLHEPTPSQEQNNQAIVMTAPPQNNSDSQKSEIPARLSPRIGFPSLENLVLERNPLGTSDPKELWKLLAKLPNLKSLNISKCSMKTTSPLIPRRYEDFSVQALLSMLNFETFEGFLKLETLNLAQNAIDSMENLMGIAFLPVLKNVYLEGNPIMDGCVPKHLQSKRRQAAKLDTFDIFSHFQSQYNIVIADDCYISPFQAGKLLSLSKKRTNTPQKKRKSGTYIKKSVNVSSESMQNPKTVAELIFSQEIIKERNEKRHYQFSDIEVKEIVKSGKIPSIKLLLALAKEKESTPTTVDPKDATKLDQDSQDLQSPQEFVPIQEETSKIIGREGEDTNLQYDPGQVDQTFITGVHITEIPARCSTSKDYESDEESITAYDIPLPLTISGSVRALRIALKNPGLLRRTTISKALYGLTKGGKIQDKSFLSKESLSLGQAAETSRSDDFEEMEEIMLKVQSKLQSLETNLMSVVNSKALYDYIALSSNGRLS